MSRRPGSLDGGEGLYWLIVGLWCILCGLAKGVAWLFTLGMSHAGKPPPDYIPQSRAAPSFESYASYCNQVLAESRVEEPSVTPDPWLLGEDDDDPEPRGQVECEVVKEPDGTIVLQAKEGSRYHRKLIPPGSFNRRN